MKQLNKIEEILGAYENLNSGVKNNLAKILMHGKLGGTGRLLILPVDQGHEHGPDKSFLTNPDAYDPLYHYDLAVEAGLSAYAAPFGFLEAGSQTYSHKIPTILKMNSSNSLSSQKNQSINSNIKEALKLGCCAVGFTIYPGSDYQYEMIEEFKEISYKASELGLVSVLWSYPRGNDISKEEETSLDIISYAAHIAAQLGAHIIKVKPPSDHIKDSSLRKKYVDQKINLASLASRISHVKKCAFNGKRLVVFSGGNAKDEKSMLEEINQIKEGGGNGSIIGRNTFQRPRQEAIEMLQEIINIYSS